MKVFAVGALLAAAAAQAHEFSPCKGSSQEHVRVEKLELSPEQPVAGQEMTVSLSGEAHEAIEQAELVAQVSVLGVVVDSETFALCDLVACPLSAGQHFEGTLTRQVPAHVPRVPATVRLFLRDQQKQLSCIESTFSIEAQPEGLLGAASHVDFLFEQWKKQWPKAIHNAEVFAQNLKRILEHNAKPDETFTMALNEFGSMTKEEFIATRLGIHEPNPEAFRNGPLKPRVTLRSNVALADPPAELDWTEKGVVSEVKNQGSCGSCWAFSAIGALESAYALKTGKLVEFSEQELVSCDNIDYACQGGLMDSAFDWIESSTHGLCTEQDYPYTSGTTSARGTCQQSTCTPVEDSVPKGYVDVPPSEAALLAAVNEHGPIAVAIEADQSAFQFYHSGVLTGNCGNKLDHGVLLVGYGVDEATGLPFWKVKNSWGGNWGEQGYIRLLRGKRFPPIGGECGISKKASYPVFE